jgi:nucleotide-binding universal stress UspA family protein
MYEHLLVGLDGSSVAERVLEHTLALATAFGSTVTLLRATDAIETLIAETATSSSNFGNIGPVMDPTPIMEAEQEDAVEYLNGLAARLHEHNVTVSTEHPEGDAAELLVERAKELGVSLILLTTHGRSGLGKVVFGSVADSVIRHAPCAVLLVKVTDHDDGGTTT